MGAFVNNHKNYNQYTAGRTVSSNYVQNFGINQGGFDIGTFLVGTAVQGTSIFLSLTSEGRGGSDNSLDPETQKKVDAKKQELETIYGKYDGVSNGRQLAKKTKTQSDKVNDEKITYSDYTKQLNSYKSELAGLNSSLKSKQNELLTLNEDDDNYAADKQAIENEIQELNQDIDAISEAIKQQEKLVQEQEKVVNDAQVELAMLNTDIGKAENIEQEIRQLEGKKLLKEVTYDVEQETKDISTFMDKLNAFQAEPNAKTAQELKDAYTNNGKDSQSGIQQKSVMKAYSMVSDRVDSILLKANLQASIDALPKQKIGNII